MSQFTLNVLAIGIFSLTMFSLLGPMLNLSPLYPAATVFVLLGIGDG